jgi:hypothetical protein
MVKDNIIVQKADTEGLSFSNLKSLYLGEWMVTDFYSPLAFFLKRAPNLAALDLDQWKVTCSISAISTYCH